MPRTVGRVFGNDLITYDFRGAIPIVAGRKRGRFSNRHAPGTALLLNWMTDWMPACAAASHTLRVVCVTWAHDAVDDRRYASSCGKYRRRVGAVEILICSTCGGVRCQSLAPDRDDFGSTSSNELADQSLADETART